MKDFPKGGLIGKTVHIIRAIGDLRISLYAANASFFIMLAVFPALVLLLSLLRHTGLTPEHLLDAMASVIPNALMDTVAGLVYSVYDSSTGTVVSISAVAALWSASRGIYGVKTGLNAIYGVGEERGYLYTRLISVGYTFLFLLVLLLTLVLHVFGTTLLRWLPAPDSPVLDLVRRIVNLRFFLLVFVQTVIFALMYAFLPGSRNGLRQSLPGALLASMGWLIFSDLYSIYVERFSGYGNLYGSVYAVALSMLWLYCCMSILFFGGALNRWLAEG